MANVICWAATWVDSGETGLQPGEQHHWWMNGFGYGDVVGITAAPLNSDAGDQILAVSNIRSEAAPSGGRTCYFTITNSGPVRAIGYAVNFSFITP